MKSFQAQTFYELLEVSVGASAGDIRAAYERLSLLYAEDQVALYGLVDERSAKALRGRLKEAVEVLLDEGRRATYDATIGLPPRELPKPALSAPRGASPVAWAQSFSFVSGPVAAPPSAPSGYVYTVTASAPVFSPAVQSSPRSSTSSVEPLKALPIDPASAGVPAAGPVADSPAKGADAVSLSLAPSPSMPVSAPPAAESNTPTAERVASQPAERVASPSLERVASPPVGLASSTEPNALPGEAAAETVIPMSVGTAAPPPPAPIAGPSTSNVAPKESPQLASAPPAPLPEPVATDRPPAESEVTSTAPLSTPATDDVAPVRAQPVQDSVPVSARPHVETPPAEEPHSELGEDAPALDGESAIVPTRSFATREYRAPERAAKPYEVPAGVEFNGDLLRQVRMARGLSLIQLSERTRIGVRHLENLEGDRYDQLPAIVYLRGMLMSLARELGLDGLRVAKSYLTFVEAHLSKAKG